MNYVVYFLVALIAVGSVLFGLDFASAPMGPMPASKYELRAAMPPSPPAAVTAETKSAPKTEAAASAVAAPTAILPAALPAVAPPPPAPVVAAAPPSIAADEPGSIAAAPPPPVPRCDLDACAAAYRTFTPEDCTYKPSDGARRLCTKGTPPVAASAPVAASPAPEARAQACNIAACSRSYPRSFSSADCTFQPSEGPRRLCTK
jgi:hypothetical protein